MSDRPLHDMPIAPSEGSLPLLAKVKQDENGDGDSMDTEPIIFALISIAAVVCLGGIFAFVRKRRKRDTKVVTSRSTPTPKIEINNNSWDTESLPIVKERQKDSVQCLMDSKIAAESSSSSSSSSTCSSVLITSSQAFKSGHFEESASNEEEGVEKGWNEFEAIEPEIGVSSVERATENIATPPILLQVSSDQEASHFCCVESSSKTCIQFSPK